MNIEELFSQAKALYDETFEARRISGNENVTMFQEASEKFMLVLEQDPDHREALHGLADSYYFMRTDDTLAKSKELYERLLARDKADARALVSLGEVYFYRLEDLSRLTTLTKKQKLTKAEECFTLAIAHNTLVDEWDAWYIFYSLGLLYEEQKKYALAAAWFRKSLDEVGENTEVLDDWDPLGCLKRCLSRISTV